MILKSKIFFDKKDIEPRIFKGAIMISLIVMSAYFDVSSIACWTWWVKGKDQAERSPSFVSINKPIPRSFSLMWTSSTLCIPSLYVMRLYAVFQFTLQLLFPYFAVNWSVLAVEYGQTYSVCAHHWCRHLIFLRIGFVLCPTTSGRFRFGMLSFYFLKLNSILQKI